MTSLNARTTLSTLLGASALAAGLALAGSPALAQGAPEAPSTGAPSTGAPSTSAMANLIRILVQNKVISQAAADALIKQAELEAAQARAAAPPPAAGAPAMQMASLPPQAPGAIRVPYVPEVVKNQIRDEVRAEVMDQVKHERWAVPEALPEWIDRITWSGDLRTRDQQNLYGKGNVGSNGQDGLIDYNAFNANANGTDINPITNPNGIPFLNTNNNRNVEYIRARIGMTAHVSDAVDVGIRLASGQTNTPVSTDQALGGGLTKKNFWLDQAYVALHPTDYAGLSFGRMPNPFLSTDLLYDTDLNFDGAAGQLKWRGDEERGFGFKAVAGAFPLGYVTDAFPTDNPTKQGDRTKWLFAAQLQADYKSDTLNWAAGAAYYDFHAVQGQLSQPCALYNGNTQCSTDLTRPAFMQKGNTLFLIRDILPDPSNPLNFAQPQLVGLAMNYKLLDLTSTVDWNAFGPYHLIVTGDYVRNLAYNAKDVCRYDPLGLPITNVQAGLDSAGEPIYFDPCSPPPAGVGAARFQSGPNAWMAKVTFGYPVIHERGEWSITAGYKYIQPDAMLDGFTDADFHYGGTNAQGYFLIGSVGVFKNTYVSARWFSANEVYGPPLQIDVGQLDLNIAF